MTVEETRRAATEQLHIVLGINADTDQLFDLAADTLGAKRVDRCRELAGRARLTRRSTACAAVAEVVAASRRLGSNWWVREHLAMNSEGAWEHRGTPEALLAVCTAPSDPHAVGSSLGLLGAWACDDAADDEWGRPIDFVDLNDSRANDRVRIPASAKIGDRLIASYDPGCRVWADVVERNTEDPELDKLGRRRGRLGTVLAEDRSCQSADVGWAWGIATNGAAVRLPGEVAGTASDPFRRPIAQSVAGNLYDTALQLGASVEALGEPWKTSGELLEAAYRLGWPYELSATWHQWGRTAEAIVDGVEIR